MPDSMIQYLIGMTFDDISEKNIVDFIRDRKNEKDMNTEPTWNAFNRHTS